MAKYIICSDIHRNIGNYEKILEYAEDADGIFISGDLEFSETYLENQFRQKTKVENALFYAVQGNCDGWTTSLPPMVLTDIKHNHRVYMVHGHRHMVPETDILMHMAKKEKADIVIYGHTHIYDYQVIDGVTIINPGAVRGGYRGPSGFAILTVFDDIINVTHYEI